MVLKQLVFQVILIELLFSLGTLFNKNSVLQPGVNHLINISFPQITGDQIRRYDLSDPQYLNTTFEDIVKKYKGNVIYIDFWASWCKPCLEQIPFVKELQRTYKEEKIVFMFISLDCNTYTWNQLINHANQGLNF